MFNYLPLNKSEERSKVGTSESGQSAWPEREIEFMFPPILCSTVADRLIDS